MAAAGPYKWAHLENIGDVYTPRTGHAVVNEDGVFYLFGGTDGAARQSDVHAYNVETNLWQEIRASGRAPPARSGAQAVVWNGNVCGHRVWSSGGVAVGFAAADVVPWHRVRSSTLQSGDFCLRSGNSVATCCVATADYAATRTTTFRDHFWSCP
eukprot:g32016.t1